MSNAMTYMGFNARVEFDADDQIFVGRITGVTDIVSFHSHTVAGLEAAFRETVDDYVRALSE